jgi:hypothetical protein
MSDTTQPPGEKKTAVTIHYESVVTCHRPSDIETQIRKHEFEMLCEGDTNKEEAKRDNAKNLFYAALMGLGGILGSSDWTVGIRQHPFLFYIFVVVFLLGVAWFGNEWRTFAWEVKQRQNDSTRSRLKGEIQRRFEAAASANAIAPREESEPTSSSTSG